MNQQTVVVCALVHRPTPTGPQAFVAKRARSKAFYPDQFELPGGHVEFGESPDAALRREFREEFGAELRLGEPFAAFSWTDQDGKQAIEIIYFAEFADPAATIQLNPDDHSEYRWVGHADVESITSAMKPAADAEFIALRRGLDILAGSGVKFS